jgi:sortase A
MALLIATALLILVIAALGVYGPLSRPGARARRSHAGPQATDPVSRLARWMRDRPAARMALSALSLALLVGAVSVIGYPFYTNLVQGRLQGQLDHQLASPELREAYIERDIAEGDSLTRILIPAIGVDVVVVEGISDSALRAGAGHYPETPLPCEIGNVAIAGHRTTYGRPFHNLDKLAPGDEITLVTPIGSCTYAVSEDPFIVTPDAIEVVDNTPDEARLTLTTCHPKGSAALRLIATATLVSSEVESS